MESLTTSLKLDSDVKPYVREDFEFGAKTDENPFRDLEGDEKTGKSAEDECQIIDFMLDTIAQFCPKIPHDDLAVDTKLLNEVWQVGIFNARMMKLLRHFILVLNRLMMIILSEQIL